MTAAATTRDELLDSAAKLLAARGIEEFVRRKRVYFAPCPLRRVARTTAA